MTTQLLSRWPDGRIKLYLTTLLLRFRKEHPDLFLQGDYTPLHMEGALDENLVAFTRQWGTQRMLVAVTRRTAGLGYTETEENSWATPWKETRLTLPRDWPSTPLTDLFSNRTLQPTDSPTRGLLAHDLFQNAPVAVLFSK